MLNDLKDFEKFLKICRKQGVTEVTYGGACVKMGELPLKQPDDSEEISTDGLSDEELAFYHLGKERSA